MLFAYDDSPGEGQAEILLAGVILHGICYDFFFVAGQIYVDETVAPSERALAQSFLVTLNMGLGVVVGSNIANAVFQRQVLPDGSHDWQDVWLFQAILSLAAAVLFAAPFRPPRGTNPLATNSRQKKEKASTARGDRGLLVGA